MENMTSLEIAVYIVFISTNCIISWQWAKHGFWEVGIQIPPNTKAIGAVIIGVITFLMAGFAEHKGYLSLSLMREENMLKGLAIIIGSPMLLFLAARYVILPKGLPEYNRAKNRTFFWTTKNYRPGVKQEKEANLLAQFPMAQKALNFFQRSIYLQKKGSRSGKITRSFTIDEEQVGWDGSMQLPCSNCGFRVKVPINARQGSGICTMCNSGLGFKVIDDNVYITAFGNKIRREITSSNKHNIAVIYEEMALLLRMMNKFDEAISALDKAEEMINEILGSAKKNKNYLTTKSLILFRKAEIAHTTGDKTGAKCLYLKSLDIDNCIGDCKERSLTERLLSEVS